MVPPVRTTGASANPSGVPAAAARTSTMRPPATKTTPSSSTVAPASMVTTRPHREYEAPASGSMGSVSAMRNLGHGGRLTGGQGRRRQSRRPRRHKVLVVVGRQGAVLHRSHRPIAGGSLPPQRAVGQVGTGDLPALAVVGGGTGDVAGKVQGGDIGEGALPVGQRAALAPRVHGDHGVAGRRQVGGHARRRRADGHDGSQVGAGGY